MPLGPEDIAREQIDRMLEQAGWAVQDAKAVNLYAKQGVAIREFELKSGYGTADYLLYVDGQAAGVIEAKKAGATLTGVEIQSAKYSKGLPDALPAWARPLPFCYESTGIETKFTNGFDPEPCSRQVFFFHKPETFADWLSDHSPSRHSRPDRESRDSSGKPLDPRVREDDELGMAAEGQGLFGKQPTLNSRIRQMPPLIETGLWPAQIVAIKNLEKSLSENRPRALIQMATGSGKTFTAINFIYRLIKFGGAKRVLFLVDRGNLGRRALKEFQQYLSPYNNFKFTEEYIAQRLTSNTLDTTARVCICTIQRLYSMLKGVELPEEGDEVSALGLDTVYKEVPPLEYNPAIPIETFDIIVTDECHRSIYNLWRQVLEYFDASIIGLTATPNKQTFGFFNQNLVMEYGHEQAVADGVNVNYEGGAGETVRRKLLHECDVHTLLRLPTGLFYAQGVKANVLFFDKKPASETPWTKKLWIYDLRTNMHFTLKTSSLQRSDLDEFVKNYNPGDRHHRKATWKAELDSGSGAGMTAEKKKKGAPSPQSSPARGEEVKSEGRWRSYTYDELVSRDKASLDIFWLKDESLEASDNLPDPDVIAQEIVEDLEAALEQFREIVGDLENGKSSRVS